jgi:hypothetical protein
MQNGEQIRKVKNIANIKAFLLNSGDSSEHVAAGALPHLKHIKTSTYRSNLAKSVATASVHPV